MNKKKKYEFIDYIFWILFILYSNPGGILQALGLMSGEGGSVSIRDFLFFLLLGCFMLVQHNRIIKSNDYHKVIKYFFIFGLYYFFVFGYFTPIFKMSEGHTFFYFLKKSRTTIYSFLLFIIVYHFYLRSHVLFFRTLFLSSIVILILFIATLITGIEILPIDTLNRSFTNAQRIFLRSYGFMPLLIPIGAVVIVFFKYKFKWKTIILIAFGLMFLAWLLSITRRHIIGTFVYLFLALVLFNYFQHKALFSTKKLFLVGFYTIVIGFVISLSFPKYIQASYDALEESIQVIQSGESSSGGKDARLGFGKDFMQNLIKENIYFGTGFDNRWRTKEGDDQGYEAADYPLLGAIAMTGIFGLLFFLPVYVLLVKSLISDLKYLRNNKVNYHSMEFFCLILFIVYFIYNLMQYMNWFRGVSLSMQSTWYIYLAMYFASRQLFYKSQENRLKYAHK